MNISVLCSTEEQIRAVLDSGIADEIIIESDSLTPDTVLRTYGSEVKLTLALPRIWRKGDVISGFDSYLIRNVDELGLLGESRKELIADYTLYGMNDEAAGFLHAYGVSRITAPVELNERELHRLRYNPEVVIYGYLPMMISAQCLKKNLSGCDKIPEVLQLKDRKGKKLPVRNICRECYNVICNPDPLSLFGVLDKVEKTGVRRARIDFSIESGERSAHILKLYKKRKDPENYTRGHFGRGVE